MSEKDSRHHNPTQAAWPAHTWQEAVRQHSEKMLEEGRVHPAPVAWLGQLFNFPVPSFSAWKVGVITIASHDKCPCGVAN
jgi:hypothetical protein